MKSKHDYVKYSGVPGFKSAAAFFISCVFYVLAQAQNGTNVTISGNITLGDGAADVIGSSISVKGKPIGAAADKNGHYTITLQRPATLLFTHVGYQTEERIVENQTQINVTLQPSANNLDQVLVLSYGTARKKDNTGSVATVNAADVQDVAAAEFGQKLQGKVAGVQINQTNGRPGQGMDFRIRGAASLSAGLYRSSFSMRSTCVRIMRRQQ